MKPPKNKKIRLETLLEWPRGGAQNRGMHKRGALVSSTSFLSFLGWQPRNPRFLGSREWRRPEREGERKKKRESFDRK